MALQKSAFWLQQYRCVHSTQAAGNWAWDAIKRAVGVSEESIKRRNAYKYAERSARETLESEIKDGAGKPSDTWMAGTEDMTNNMTGDRSWKSVNADLEADREELNKIKWTEGEKK